MDAVKSLVILEFKKITEGYKFLSNIKNSNFDFFEISPQSPGKLVCLIGGGEAETNEIWSAVKKAKKNILNSYFLKNNVVEILKSLYGQQKPSAQDFFGVIQTKSVSASIKISDYLLTNSKIYLLEIDSGRSLNGTSLVYFTGNKSEQKKIQRIAKIQNADIAILQKGNPITSRYFQLG
ncbi:MAG: hypothetical protein A4S09_10550 [Proteobacteria bacterium SG_bin7]|nr:MAG: hypothetical protein A4S09_10550 [Proteobacteria bacterium SG_bin7]